VHVVNPNKNKTLKDMVYKLDFELTKAQKEIQKTAIDFAKGEFDKDLALDLEKNTSFRKIYGKKPQS
jgi:hypothetical protein